MTVNESLNLMKVVRKRISELETLRDKVSTKEIWMTNTTKTEEPQYDVKLVDIKITELQKIQFDLDNAIKNSNATTKVNLTIDINKIFEPLK